MKSLESCFTVPKGLCKLASIQYNNPFVQLIFGNKFIIFMTFSCIEITNLKIFLTNYTTSICFGGSQRKNMNLKHQNMSYLI